VLHQQFPIVLKHRLKSNHQITHEVDLPMSHLTSFSCVSIKSRSCLMDSASSTSCRSVLTTGDHSRSAAGAPVGNDRSISVWRYMPQTQNTIMTTVLNWLWFHGPTVFSIHMLGLTLTYMTLPDSLKIAFSQCWGHYDGPNPYPQDASRLRKSLRSLGDLQ